MTNHPLPFLAKEGSGNTPLKRIPNEFCNAVIALACVMQS